MILWAGPKALLFLFKMGISSITIGSSFECDNPVQAGVSDVLRLFNYDDIIGYSISSTGKILAIYLAAGTTAYRFEGFRNDVKKSEEVVKGNLNNRFIHRVSFVVYEGTEIQKKNLKALAKGRFIAVTESNGKTADAFELLGKGAGLSMEENTIRDAYSNSGLFVLNLSTADDEYELKLPQTIGNDYNDAVEIIDEIDGDESGIFDHTFDDSFN